MRIAVPDLVTNSYFPALAAEELEAHVELLAPAPRAMAALRDGQVDALNGFVQYMGFPTPPSHTNR